MKKEFEIGEVIADRRMTYVEDNGNSRDVLVRIGRPVPDLIDDVEQWVCPFQIMGIGDGAVKGIFGIDAMQALLLGIHSIPAELAAHVLYQGGRFQRYGEDDTSFVFGCRTVLTYSDEMFPATEA